MPEIKIPSAGDVVVIRFVNKLEKAVDNEESGYISGKLVFPDSIVRAFNSIKNSLTFTPDFFGKRDNFVIMRFGTLVILVNEKSISETLIV